MEINCYIDFTYFVSYIHEVFSTVGKIVRKYTRYFKLSKTMTY